MTISTMLLRELTNCENVFLRESTSDLVTGRSGLCFLWGRQVKRGFISVQTELRGKEVGAQSRDSRHVFEQTQLVSLLKAVCSKCCIGKITEGSHLEKKQTTFFSPLSGPGVLTRTLLNAGVRVVALESHSAFLPNLQSLENSLDGQLKVIYGDFFRLDPLITGPVKPPAVCSEKLFESMGVVAVPWRADVPVKIFAILPQKKERNTLWRLLFALYECSSIYKYGRVELNFFISEKEYEVLTAKPGEVRAYQALTVLWQVGCEIQLLHMEPWSSFITNLKNGGLAVPKSTWLPNDHLCLVRLTPRQSLFTGGMKPTNSATFIFMVKQCLAKPRSRLIDRLNSWSLYNGRKLLRELEIPENAQTVNLYPEDYRRLFEALQNSSVFTESWFHDEVLESIRNINF
nr:PREDICTED: dimethyladenosine transferase 2, mitochondrial [Struthio camelus australis]